jgi:hypothetical protein
MKFRDAFAANAGPVAQVNGNAREQLPGDVHLGAPTGAFVGLRGAELTVVGASTERATQGIDSGIGGGQNHDNENDEANLFGLFFTELPTAVMVVI